MQKLVNIQLFGQIRDQSSIAQFIVAERGQNNHFLPRHAGDWWLQYGRPTEQIVPPPITTPSVIIQCWEDIRRGDFHEAHAPAPPSPDSLSLLSLSIDDLHVAFRMGEQLMQEAAMEAISTLKYLKEVN